MTSVTSKIKEAFPRNTELLAILSETDHALPALEQQKQNLQHLDNELSVTRKRIAALHKQRVKEFKEHKKYRDSVMKRFAYRVSGKTGKFEAKAEKEEHEYFAALQEEHRAKEREASLECMRSEALDVQSDLERQVCRHIEAQQKLDSLYDGIFQGPTSAFPEEDRSEQNADSALQAYHNARAKAETEFQVVRLLTEAMERLNRAISYTEEALSHSRMDMFGGGTFSDMMERNALEKAEDQVSQMLWLVRQAQRASENVQDLPVISIARGNLMSDVFFDNIFSDMAFHDKIKDSRSGLDRAYDSLRDHLAAAKMRHQEAEQDTNLYAAALKTAREELQKARERIFERVTTGDVGSQATPVDDPPPY
ncbi:hypothetical protein AAE478_001029 [Parahypoxylon ruwenzoriense]